MAILYKPKRPKRKKEKEPSGPVRFSVYVKKKDTTLKAWHLPGTRFKSCPHCCMATVEYKEGKECQCGAIVVRVDREQY